MFRIEIEDQALPIDLWLTGNPALATDKHDAGINDGTHVFLTQPPFDHITEMLPLAGKLSIPVVGHYNPMSRPANL